MKSKKLALIPLLLIVFVFAIGYVGFRFFDSSRGPLNGSIEKEWLERRFPEKVDTADTIWQVLPFGYTLGPWPNQFRNEPIVTKLTYSKGPPKKFLQSITQLWQPVEAELTMMGPKTIDPELKQSDWKDCFESSWSCKSPRVKLLEYVSGGKKDGQLNKVTWFDHLEPDGPRGLHLLWDFPKYRIDDFIVITESGIAQNFELKSVKSEIGDEARSLIYQTLGSLKVKEDLKASREWIQSRIRSVKLDEIQALGDRKQKLSRLIEIQNWLFSLLSVDPTEVTPFFHLAGVTHLLALELIKLQTTYFENQESWILSAKPNLDTLYQYSKDFEEVSIPKQIEALIQDVLLQQQKSSTALKNN